KGEPGSRFCKPVEVWWSQTGSNRRPPACKAGALPTELWPRGISSTWRACRKLVGLGGLEPPTPRLSSVCSNQLSYRPRWVGRRNVRLQLLASDLSGCSRSVAKASLKEVIQPQVPLRLPCYDFTPVIGHTVDGA